MINKKMKNKFILCLVFEILKKKKQRKNNMKNNNNKFKINKLILKLRLTNPSKKKNELGF